MSEFQLEKRHLDFVSQIETDLRAGRNHSKRSIEKLAESLGFTNQNLIKELTELAIVRMAREIAHEQSSTRERFDKIVEIYVHQANLSHRTSHSMLLQQYSTPAPISFLAGTYVLGDEHHNPLYFEPSAGNGLLTIAFDPTMTIVNEIDEIRLANLHTQPFREILNQDATIPFTTFYKTFDGIITNPPFGTLIEPVRFDEYEFKTLDHLMALRALDTMKDSGRAAIIIGGHTDWDDKGRIQAGKNRIFFNYLYNHYLVDDVLNLDGHALYSRQGTAFNVRLILISGRKSIQQGYAPLKSNSDVVVDTFDELYRRISIFLNENKAGEKVPVPVDVKQRLLHLKQQMQQS